MVRKVNPLGTMPPEIDPVLYIGLVLSDTGRFVIPRPVASHQVAGRLAGQCVSTKVQKMGGITFFWAIFEWNMNGNMND